MPGNSAAIICAFFMAAAIGLIVWPFVREGFIYDEEQEFSKQINNASKKRKQRPFNPNNKPFKHPRTLKKSAPPLKTYSARVQKKPSDAPPSVADFDETEKELRLPWKQAEAPFSPSAKKNKKRPQPVFSGAPTSRSSDDNPFKKRELLFIRTKSEEELDGAESKHKSVSIKEKRPENPTKTKTERIVIYPSYSGGTEKSPVKTETSNLRKLREPEEEPETYIPKRAAKLRELEREIELLEETEYKPKRAKTE